MPLVLASSSEPTIVVAHAGWRGLAAGILAGAVALFERPGDVAVAIGPAIGPDHYEVGSEVVAAVERARLSSVAASRPGERSALDLVGTARGMLGEPASGTWGHGPVYRVRAFGFFSHRAEGGTTGRQVAIAVRPSEGPDGSRGGSGGGARAVLGS